ncbi:polymer-forming cytoskeletal protein [Desulforamulus ruminis]|uniref:DUF8173 domain-containing protein n=1 Tax=Desulforamulus ruminis (strain ATCC 23193 / DSM 2154 / NCIMB 8452 / DL) TaxID=696281 RepID=F6DSE1_DESRL|nr:polymer-forming cytoskeletal protein [Desulforamulus ruminis]AEG59920.1 hypothetical protein Desru_1655 [Desulforamulus ruminis DSM 2154]
MLGKRRKPFSVIILSCLLLLLIPAAALAVDIRDEAATTVIDSGETVKGPGFYSGNVVEINGTIDGSLFVAAQKVHISGKVKGNVYSASEEIQVSGMIEGTLHSVARNISIGGQVNGDVLTASEKISILREAVLKRDVMSVASQVEHDGKIERQMLAAAKHMMISGEVGDDTRITAEKLAILDSASLHGNLAYESPVQATVESKAKITGETQWKKAETKETTENQLLNRFVSLLLGVAGALLVWLIVILWRPKLWLAIARPIFERPLASLGAGALTLVLIPLTVLLLMLTVVGIPLAVVLGLIYGISLYISKIIVAVWAGYWLANRFNWSQRHKGAWLVLLGLAILALLTNLPYFGLFFSLLVLFAGLGALVLSQWRQGDGPAAS